MPSFDMPANASGGERIPVTSNSTTAPIRITSGVTWLKINSPNTSPTRPKVNWAGVTTQFCQEKTDQGMLQPAAGMRDGRFDHGRTVAAAVGFERPPDERRDWDRWGIITLVEYAA